MKKEKIYKIISTHNGYDSVWEGTMYYLINNVFGDVLETGHSLNKKINKKPKTGVALVKALTQTSAETRSYSDCFRIG